MDKLKEILENLIKSLNANGEPSLIKLVFGDLRKKSLPYKKVTIRPVKIGGSFVFQAEYTYTNKVIHEADKCLYGGRRNAGARCKTGQPKSDFAKNRRFQ